MTSHGRKGEQTRQQILAAATGVFSKYGYEKASIARICAAVGIARGTLYQYFRDKHSLFCAQIDEQLEQIQHFVEPIDRQASDVPEPEPALYQRLLRVSELIHGHQDVFRLMAREARVRNPETEDRVRKGQREIFPPWLRNFIRGRVLVNTAARTRSSQRPWGAFSRLSSGTSSSPRGLSTRRLWPAR